MPTACRGRAGSPAVTGTSASLHAGRRAGAGTAEVRTLPWAPGLGAGWRHHRVAGFGGLLSAVYFGATLAAAPFGVRTSKVLHYWVPAYNAEKTLERTLNDISPGACDEVILVDDCSTDGTFDLARRLGLTSARHEKNLGYGGNQKTCYRMALERGRVVYYDIIGPSTWNGAPRDGQERPGGIEQALNRERLDLGSRRGRLDAARIVHSYFYSSSDAVQ